MTLAEFQSTVEAGDEPTVAPLLLALWHHARGIVVELLAPF